MKKRLLFVSMHYAPEPCDTRTSALAEAFAARGYECTVLTSFPNYPFGRVYPGYRQRLCRKETINGVRVLRVPMFADHSKSVVRRALSYLSFGLSAALVGAFFVGRQRLVWVHHPPLTTGFAGWWLSKLCRAPFVLEVHDLWPETFVSTGMVREGRVCRAIRRACDFLYKRAASVIVTSEGVRAHLVAQGLDERRVVVLPQWAEESKVAIEERSEDFGRASGMEGAFNVVFTGNVGVAQGLETLIDAAVVLQNVPDVRIHIVGDGLVLESLKARAQDRGVANVSFVGQVPRESLSQYYAWADALLVHLVDDPLFRITVPSKTQTYLLAGRPLLCGVKGDTAKIVEEAGAGVCFEPQDAASLAAAVLRLKAMSRLEREGMATRARGAYEAEFAQAALVPRYQSLFAALTGGAATHSVAGTFQESGTGRKAA